MANEPKKIELTAEQEKLLEVRYQEWLKVGLSTEPADKPRAEAAIKAIYTAAGMKLPAKVTWVGSPAAAIDYLVKSMKVKREDALNLSRFYGAHEAYWVAYYKFAEEIGVEYDKADSALLDLWAEVAKSCGWWWPGEDEVVIADRPEAIHWEESENPRLHNAKGPAVRYRDGWEAYHVHGIPVPKEAIMDPNWLTVEKIDKEQNAEVRRTYMNIFGEGRYLEQSGAKCISEDTCGKLYHKDIPGDEPLRAVRVVNSTPEPDGTNRIYWLRVPPETKTAREGVAWTFNMKEKDYKPQAES